MIKAEAEVRRVRVLVTNDDGIAAPGLHVLAAALVDAGHDVIVVAPANDCSGQGAAVGPLHLMGKIEFERVELEGLAVDAMAVDGPPALAVMAACLGGFGPVPDVVCSGINAGTNTGRAVLHSGTVGAALTAANFGLPAIAVSQAVGDTHGWGAATAIAVSLVAHRLRMTRPPVLSLNVPNLALADLRGLVPAGLDPGGTVQAAIVEREAGVLELRLPELQPPPPGTDTALLAEGYATLTALVGPSSPGVDLSEICRSSERVLRQAAAGRIPA